MVGWGCQSDNCIHTCTIILPKSIKQFQTQTNCEHMQKIKSSIEKINSFKIKSRPTNMTKPIYKRRIVQMYVRNKLCYLLSLVYQFLDEWFYFSDRTTVRLCVRFDEKASSTTNREKLNRFNRFSEYICSCISVCTMMHVHVYIQTWCGHLFMNWVMCSDLSHHSHVAKKRICYLNRENSCQMHHWHANRI